MAMLGVIPTVAFSSDQGGEERSFPRASMVMATDSPAVNVTTSWSCDRIITKTGDTISCRIRDIGTKRLHYDACTHDNGSASIERSKVERVRYGTETGQQARKERGSALAAFGTLTAGMIAIMAVIGASFLLLLESLMSITID